MEIKRRADCHVIGLLVQLVSKPQTPLDYVQTTSNNSTMNLFERFPNKNSTIYGRMATPQPQTSFFVLH
ncbi:MAG TPA: hypothetical protein VJH92_01685 [Candidatus Nanoarchaeia archaeon]|nr:hypothetical protein [Candidatus Nanoarchaeia archaeon]